MDKLRAVELFVRLNDVGSFTRVAELTGYSKSMISKEVSRLEKELGARLLHRSTRKIQLTHVGRGYLQRAREILAQLDDADEFVKNTQITPKGKLKINAPMALGIIELSEMFADFMREYPDIELDIHLGDEEIDLIEQGFDLGFRASSQVIDTAYVGRPIREFNYHICASTSYLHDHQPIRTPQDLKQHNCFVYSYFKGRSTWPIEDGVNVDGTLKVNSVMFMLQVVKAGLGVGFMPDFICKPAIEAGELVEVLPNAKKPNLTLYAIYPTRHYVPATTVQCISFLEQWLKARN